MPTPEDLLNRIQSWDRTLAGMGIYQLMAEDPNCIIQFQYDGDDRRLADGMFRLGDQLKRYAMNLYEQIGGIEAAIARDRAQRANGGDQASGGLARVESGEFSELEPVPGRSQDLPPAQRRRREAASPPVETRKVEPIDPATLGARAEPMAQGGALSPGKPR